MIIKKYMMDKSWSMLFCLAGTTCNAGGFISHEAFEKMKSDNIIKEIPEIHIIEKYYRHVPLISDVAACKYFEVVIAHPG